MDQRRTALLAGAVGLLGYGLQSGPRFAVLGTRDAELPAWLPTIGTVGETIVVYTYLFETIGTLAPLALGVGFGVVFGRRIDVPREYRQFGTAVFAGSSLAAVTVWVALLVFAGLEFVSDSAGVVMGLGSLVAAIASVPVPLAVGALAGATLAHFESEDGSRSRYAPVESDDADPSGDGDGYSKLET